MQAIILPTYTVCGPIKVSLGGINGFGDRFLPRIEDPAIMFPIERVGVFSGS